MISPGELRASQLITTFGPGSIVDLRDDSILVYDLVDWHSDEPISEPRLEKFLKVHTFYAPPIDNNDGDIPVTTFPKYKVCTKDKCSILSFKPKKNKCPACSADLHPARLIIACPNGHIDDFPWTEWAHQGSSTCQKPFLKLKSRGRTATLADLQVQCLASGCESKGLPQNLARALQEGALKEIMASCTARRPWLRKDDPVCDALPRALLRGASNVYFPSLASALSLPKWSSRIMQALNRVWPMLAPFLQDPSERFIVRKLIEKHLIDEVEEFGLDSIMAAIEMRDTLVVESNQKLLIDEWGAFLSDNNSSTDFSISKGAVHEELRDVISNLIVCDRLKEVRVLRGFTRIDPPDPEQPDQILAPLSSSKNANWLPAIEVRGEGIFLAFNEEAIAKWEKREQVAIRIDKLLDSYLNMRIARGFPPKDPPLRRYVLLHSISHVLIRQFSLTCGYSSSSLRERIYSGEGMAGILIYTASNDSDGSLGGLIQQASIERFSALLRESINSAFCCSSDPLCREQIPAAKGSVNAACCHACLLVPETACECSNRLLDRASIVNLPRLENLGFFQLFEK